MPGSFAMLLIGSRREKRAEAVSLTLLDDVPSAVVLATLHEYVHSLILPRQDFHRMAEINKEIGLEDVLQGMGMGQPDSGGETSSSDEDQKKGGFDRISQAKEVESVCEGRQI